MTDSYTYDVFGAPRTSTGTSIQPFRFTGQQRDAATGLYYMRARFYDPTVGRFQTEDPLPVPQGYAYVRNNSVNRVDPTGMSGNPPCPTPIPVPTPRPTGTPTPPTSKEGGGGVSVRKFLDCVYDCACVSSIGPIPLPGPVRAIGCGIIYGAAVTGCGAVCGTCAFATNPLSCGICLSCLDGLGLQAALCVRQCTL